MLWSVVRPTSTRSIRVFCLFGESSQHPRTRLRMRVALLRVCKLESRTGGRSAQRQKSFSRVPCGSDILRALPGVRRRSCWATRSGWLRATTGISHRTTFRARSTSCGGSTFPQRNTDQLACWLSAVCDLYFIKAFGRERYNKLRQAHVPDLVYVSRMLWCSPWGQVAGHGAPPAGHSRARVACSAAA